MLNRSLTEHATGCFYGSDRLAVRLWDELVKPQPDLTHDGWPALQDDCYQQLVEALDTRYPRRYRLNDIRRLMDCLCDARLFIDSELPWLDELFDQLLHRNGDMICYRENQVQAYARMAAELDPTLLVAWHLSGWLKVSPQPHARDVCRVVTAQAPFFAPPTNLTCAYAEGHVHLGGIAADNVILGDYLLKADGFRKIRERDKDADCISQQLKRMRQLLILFLEYSEEDDWPGNFGSKLNASISVKEILPDWELLATSHTTAAEGSVLWVRGQFALAMMRGCANSWLWLLLFLCCLYRDKRLNPRGRVGILCWLQMLNDLRRRLIMDGQGLTRFVEHYFQGPLGRGGGTALQDNVRRLLVMKGDVAEVKALPGTFSPKFAAKFADAVGRQSKQFGILPPYIFGEHEVPPDGVAGQYMQSQERWQFCGHFSRSQKKKRASSKEPRADLEALWSSADELLVSLSRHGGWNLPEFLGGHLNQSFRFHPARWFRGLDVAGDENDLRIEWFAPMLRWLRLGFVSRLHDEQASSGFHLSIHAGEDYAHPLSGMRHIDETVDFCEMRNGDRLGHALAMGIEPGEWMSRQGEMIIPLDEHLDNLVWLWHYATTLSGRLPLAQQVLPIIERRIARIFPFTQWLQPPRLDQEENCSESKQWEGAIPPSDLYRAWRLRRNCHYLWKKLSGDLPRSERERCAVPDAAAINHPSDLAACIYRHRHQHLAVHSKLPLVVVRVGSEWDGQELFRKNMKPVRGIIDDVDTGPEVDFMHALQDFLIDQYDQMGLIIETNPTSNVYIARLKDHSEHPIFRWNPPDESVLKVGGRHNRFGLRRGPVRVLVNTDDPGIMPTTLRTEYSLLREAAVALGVTRTVAEEWLDRLRRYGLEQFQRNHLTVFEAKGP